MLFDARAAKQLLPGSHIVVHGCPGLRLEASTAGKSWTYRYKINGRMRQVKIGKWPAMPAAAAATRWQELRDLRDSGVDPSQQRKEQRLAAQAKAYTVANVVDDYYTGHLAINRKPAGANAVYARLVGAVAGIAATPAATLTRRMAFDLIASLADKPVAAKSVRNEMGAAWDLALDAGLLPEESPNWWRQIMAGKLRSKGALRAGQHKGTTQRVLSEAEIARLLAADFALLSPTVQDVLALYLWTGARGGEIVQMHANHITSESDGVWWTMPKETTKNARRASAADVRVPLIGRALAVVQRRIKDNPAGYVFAAKTKSGYTDQPGINSQVHFRQPYSNSRPEITRSRLSVTHWSPHDLRRTVRTMLASMGCPSEVAEAILGHMQPGIQGVYNKYAYDKERRHWLTLLAGRLEGLLAASSPSAR
jgi:integrase